ncbi:wall-associated receptor kinase-like 20 [Aristolochia californica]|uniref:wall-associated receptor kinase-like 20 n=1 Tax=Aristolochia californica TaxID=171875 RepID=UPI0035E095C5
MGKPLAFFFFLLILVFSMPRRALAALSPCKNKCGSLEVQYPLGSGPGCGSPRFQSSISCSPSDELLLITHTGSYPVTSISYATSTLTIVPPLMSSCSAMHSSPNFGLDWSSPFQLGSSLFLLLGCSNPSSSLTYKGTPLCDPVNAHLCAALYTCPSVTSLGLPLFSPSNSCCAYSPANLGPHGDLDVQGLLCAGYSSVVSLGDIPTDPTRWEYGVVLKFGLGGVDNYNFATACQACQHSSGICGYAPPRNYFVCVCQNGVNTSSDCNGQAPIWNQATIHHPKLLGFSIYGSWLLAILGLSFFFVKL